MSLNIFGDGLRDALDPRSKVRIGALDAGVRHPAPHRNGARAVRGQLPRVRDLHRRPRRRSGDADRGQERERPADREHPPHLGLRPAVLHAVLDHDEEDVFSGRARARYTNQTNVLDQIKAGVPATFSLAIGAAIIWLFFGVAVGIVAAVTAGRWSDRLVTIFALIGISMPVFWLGIIVRYYLAEGGLITIFPDGEYVPLTTNPAQWFWHLILPWGVLAVLFIGFYGRVLRGNILDTINEDYVRTARAKGLNPRA